MRISWIRLALAALILGWPIAVQAQAPRPRVGDICDVSWDPVYVSQPYNPMSPDDYAASLTATAHSSGGSVTTNYSAALLRQPIDRGSIDIFLAGDDGAGSGNVVYDPPGPRLANGLDDAGEIDLQFDHTTSPIVSRTVQMQLRIPAGAEIDSGIAVAELDVKYLCDYQDERSDKGTNRRAFMIYFHVNTAIQASLTGSEPDFGEIGTLSDIDVAGAGPSVRQRRHFLRVASTGPYEVMVVSQNGWRMTATGAPTGNAAERIGYSYELLDQELDSGRPNFTPVICEASGTSGENIRLTATLTEGGLGKVPSPGYRDIITITVTPLATTVGGAVRCD